MPFLAAFKEAKLRSFVTPGTALIVSATLQHEGSGFAVTQAEIKRDNDRLICNAEITFRLVPFPNHEFRDEHGRGRGRHRLPDGVARPWLTHGARPGSPASASSPASAKGRTRTGSGSTSRRRRPITKPSRPIVVHPLAPLDLDKQIPKKGDQRQMEPWQRIGTYAAGLALDCAGVKGNAELLARMDMIVAAGGGERDEAVDLAILSGLGKAERKDAFLNERLMSDLRPTLFLAQLSNLLAGNISIVHGVTGSSRTFMGEEAAGVDAVRIALVAHRRPARATSRWSAAPSTASARICCCSMRSAITLLQDAFAPVWERAERGGGMVLGSLGAFLVLEAREHAAARGAKPLARLCSGAVRPQPPAAGRRHGGAARMWGKHRAATAYPAAWRVISGATGAEPATARGARLARLDARGAGARHRHLYRARRSSRNSS